MTLERLNIETPNASGSQIVLTDLCYSVDGKGILQGITLKTSAPRIGIVGRNGSGKSTLARILAGLIEPTSGSALVNGHNLAKDRKAALAEVGILFQNPDHQIIFPTVLEEVSFGLRQLGQAKKTAEENARKTLDAFGKAHWADAYVNNLSQGQKHLVCLMAVVAMQPRMIILDEPYSGLDIPTKHQLTRYLSRYQGALLHITHDPSDLSGYDDVVWLEQGAVEQSGAADVVIPAYVAQMNTLGGSDDISDLSH